MSGKTRTPNAERLTPNAEGKAGEYPLVLFTSTDGAVTVPTRLERDTLWLTQEQMAQVFEVKRPAVTKHLANIFKTGELDQISVRSILEHTAADGNKRIGAALFLYFLDKSRRLLTRSGEKRIADHTLVALTVMIAESKPAERELMVNLVMTFLMEDDHA